MRVDLQPAYVLHARPYRDTSLLLDLLTPVYGRITAVARGVRQGKGSKRQMLNPFQRLLVNWQGKSNLKLITAFESDQHQLRLVANHLYAGFYLNEILVRLLPEQDAIPYLFEVYEQSLRRLAGQEELEPILRQLEFFLLAGLGYGLDFTQDARDSAPIRPDRNYCCDIHEGFFTLPADVDAREHQSGESQPGSLFPGAVLLAIAASDYSAHETRQQAKRLSRMLFKPLLGRRPLKSRELFGAPKNPQQNSP